MEKGKKKQRKKLEKEKEGKKGGRKGKSLNSCSTVYALESITTMEKKAVGDNPVPYSKLKEVPVTTLTHIRSKMSASLPKFDMTRFLLLHRAKTYGGLHPGRE